MSNNQEHTNTDNMENQTQQALEKDSAQYANEVTGAENAAEKDSAGKKPGSTVPGRDEKRIRELAESIYDLDAEVYAQLGSSLGRVFNRDRKRCVVPLEQKGALLDAIFEYASTGTIIDLPPVVSMAFNFFL